MSIKVIVAGFKGRMGSTAVEMVKGDDEMTLAALLDPCLGGFHYASCCL